MSFEQEIRIVELENELRMVRARLAAVEFGYPEDLQEEAKASSIIEAYKAASKAQVQWANALELDQMGMIEDPKELFEVAEKAQKAWAKYRELRHG